MTPKWPRKSIGRELTAVSAASSILALLLACSAFLVYDLVTFRSALLTDVTSDARMLALNVVAPLLFDDPKAASTSLASLQGKPRIRSAVLRTAKRAVFASYGTGRTSFPADGAATETHRFEADQLVLSVPVTSEGAIIGELTLEAGLGEIGQRVRRYLLLTFGVLLASLWAALAATGWLRQRILEPVTRLTDAARRVSRESDYSVRVAMPDDDELGLLAVTFNAMLGTIEQQNAALKLESEQRLRLLVDSVKDYALFMLDAEGNILTWNKGAEGIKQYSPEEAIGRNIAMFYTPEDRAAGRPEQLLARARRDGRVEDEGWRVRKDGSRFWADVVITAMADPSGEVKGFSKVTRDLTERRKAENERLRLVKAQEAVALRDEFLSIASHELKTPLTALQLQLQSARRVVEGPPRGKIERAAQSAQRLSQLIETLLDVSRIASGHIALHPEPGELRHIAMEVVERLEPTVSADAAPIRLIDGPPVHGTWDSLRIGQVLTNLVFNAVKYGQNTAVEIDVRREGESAVIEVADRGPGIAAPDLERIFGRFERAASMRHFGGLGLGLYIARQIVEAHGGEVGVRNRSGGGACFTVRLPLVASASTPAGDRP